MDFFNVVERRGSYREEFAQEAVPKETIEKMVSAAQKAPSGYNGQTTSFIAITEAGLRQKISDILPTPAVKTAPLLFAVITEKIVYHDDLVFEMQNYGAATENLMLAITDLGYAGVWMDGDTELADRKSQTFEKLLKLPEKYTLQAIIPVGKPLKEVTQKPKKELSAILHWQTFE